MKPLDDGPLEPNPGVMADAEYVARLIAHESRWRGQRAQQTKAAFCGEVLHQVFQRQLRAKDDFRRWAEGDPDIGRRPPNTDDPPDPDPDRDPDIPF